MYHVEGRGQEAWSLCDKQAQNKYIVMNGNKTSDDKKDIIS